LINYLKNSEYPTIWCAIGSRIKIYEAITWTEESTNLKINEKIVRIFGLFKKI
jgi:hypothetical protein